jgi:hypothetical protein
MTTTTNSSSVSFASVYQQLRAHLTTLRLHDAAEALPAALDNAAAEKLAFDRRAGTRCSPSRSTPPKPAAWPDGSGSPACRPRPPSPTSTTTPPPVDKALIRELCTCRYLETATNVLMIGPPGVGKTLSDRVESRSRSATGKWWPARAPLPVVRQ